MKTGYYVIGLICVLILLERGGFSETEIDVPVSVDLSADYGVVDDGGVDDGVVDDVLYGVYNVTDVGSDLIFILVVGIMMTMVVGTFRILGL